MEQWQYNLITGWLLYAVLGFVIGIYKTKSKRSTFGVSWPYLAYGAFVWGDAVVFGLFWIIASIAILILNDWLLGLLTFSTFWMVRSVGETMYWFLQQFTPSRNKPENMIGYRLFSEGDSIWFVYQTFVQCITVSTVITTIYLAGLWLSQKL